METTKWGVWASRSAASVFGAAQSWVRVNDNTFVGTEAQAREMVQSLQGVRNVSYEAKPFTEVGPRNLEESDETRTLSDLPSSKMVEVKETVGQPQPEIVMTAKTVKAPKAAKKTVKTAKVRTAREGLRIGQVRILKALAKLAPQAGLTRAKLSEITGATLGWVFWFTGATDLKTRATSEKSSGFPSLLSLKAISTAIVQSDEDGPKERIYRITATGRNLLEKALADPKVVAKMKSKKAK